jgi:myosin-1
MLASCNSLPDGERSVRVRRAGFAYRQLIDRFFGRYKMLCKRAWPIFKGTGREGLEMLLKEHNIKPEEYRIGKTKIFIRNPTTVAPLSIAFFMCSWL